ncbi:hypothetical protein JCM16303_003347 [Sporobolomyces ruberrimus]
MSKILHRRGSASEKGEANPFGSIPAHPRPRPTFSLSSLSFRRPSVASTASSTLTPPESPPPETPPPVQPDPELSQSSSDSSSFVLHIRVPPPSLFDPFPEPLSFLGRSPAHAHLQKASPSEHLHSHSAPPSPIIDAFPFPPRFTQDRHPQELPPSTSQSSDTSLRNEPPSAFSDWGTSINGTSRNASSANLSDGEEEGSATEGSSSVDANAREHSVVDATFTAIGDHQDPELNDEPSPSGIPSQRKSSASSKPTSHLDSLPSASSTLNPSHRRSAPTASDKHPAPVLIQKPTPLHHRPHLAPHHHHSIHSKFPRESKVADSSYPELAIAFFLSRKQLFKGRKLERRASTGSLGGAV